MAALIESQISSSESRNNMCDICRKIYKCLVDSGADLQKITNQLRKSDKLKQCGVCDKKICLEDLLREENCLRNILADMKDHLRNHFDESDEISTATGGQEERESITSINCQLLKDIFGKLVEVCTECNNLCVDLKRENKFNKVKCQQCSQEEYTNLKGEIMDLDEILLGMGKEVKNHIEKSEMHETQTEALGSSGGRDANNVAENLCASCGRDSNNGGVDSAYLSWGAEGIMDPFDNRTDRNAVYFDYANRQGLVLEESMEQLNIEGNEKEQTHKKQVDS